MRSVVTGAGGFIGGHLVAALLAKGYDVFAVDIKPIAEWHQLHDPAMNVQADLTERYNCQAAVDEADEVFNLAADMGGIGFIEGNRADCAMSVILTAQMLDAANDEGVARYLQASSACVYAADRQIDAEAVPLRESDAYPAMPEAGYGWEKLYGELLCTYVGEDYGLEVRLPRFHNIYGPHGTWAGGREKAPAAICRKVAEAVISGSKTIEVWGDGEQTRSFCWVGDCVDGMFRLMDSDFRGPINLGSAELVTINELISVVEAVAGVKLDRSYDLSAPQGVRGRNSDNTLIREVLDWEPSTTLVDGIALTYPWVFDQVHAQR